MKTITATISYEAPDAAGAYKTGDLVTRHPVLLALDVDLPEGVSVHVHADVFLPRDFEAFHAPDLEHDGADGAFTVEYHHRLQGHAPDDHGFTGRHGFQNPELFLHVLASDGGRYPVTGRAQLHPHAVKHF